MNFSNSNACNPSIKFRRKREVLVNQPSLLGKSNPFSLAPSLARKLAAWASLAAISIAVLPAANAADFYVSPSGSSSGDGSSSRPWNLQTALNHPSSVRPGDTIWLKGGVYKGSFTSRLTGISGSYVTVRQAPGERAIIDGSGSDNNTFTVQGAWSCFWGFEVTNTDSSRPNVQWTRPHGVTAAAPNTRFVNLTVHDAGQGFGAWSDAPGAEIYGCVIFNNGNSKFDHGIYSQNSTGTKRIADNIIFNNFGYGLHLYGSDSAYIRGFDVQGNTLFNNGSISKTDAQNIIISGGNAMERIRVLDNYTYDGFADGSVTIGSDSANKDLTLQNNYFADYTRIERWQTINALGNTFIAPTTILEFNSYVSLPTSVYTWNRNSFFSEELAYKPFYFSSSSGTRSTDFAGWKSGSGLDSGSTYAKGRPTGLKVFIRPNQYEKGRANITVYNWDLRSTVSVDLTSVLASGTRYEIRSAQDFLGAPVLSGTYSGGTVSLPMTGLRVAAPYGLSAPASTAPLFNAFVVIPLSTAPTPPPPSNTAPTISTIPDQVISEDGATSALAFTVGDAETSASNLSVLGSSSNPTLVPNANVRFGGSGANRTVTITPAANQSGMTMITLSVVDGSLITTRAFKVTVNAVNDAPTITSISGQTIGVNTATPALGFTIGDIETSAGSLIVSGSSSNPTLVPASGITFGGTDSSRTVTVKPAAGQTGTANITVTVNDGSASASTTFTVTVSGTTTPPPTGKVIIELEAESGVLASPMAIASHTGARQGKYIVSNTANSGTATYTVNIPTTGEYVIWCRVLALDTADRGSHDSVFVSVNGNEDVYDVAEGKWSSSWQWTVVNGRAGSQPLTLNPRVFYMTAGQQKIVIRGRETGTNIDAILVTNDRSYVPAP